MAIHKSVTAKKVLAAAKRDDGTGYCLKCGARRGCCEPDARKYPCEKSGEKAVFGAQEILLYLF
jgi:hypothetical protein